MKISLKRAHALQQEIKNLIQEKNQEISPNISFSDDSINPRELLSAKRDSVLEAVIAVADLYGTLQIVRSLVKKANLEVDELLSIQAFLTNKAELLQRVINFGFGKYSIETIESKIAKLNDKDYRQYGSSIFVETALLESDNKAFKTQLSQTKKSIQTTKEKIAELNLTTQIEIPESAAGILQKYDLL